MGRSAERSEEDWKESLDPERYHVLREGGTEPAFSGAYWDKKEEGVYRCAGCHTILFSSDTKYDSGSGWPSFWDAVDPELVVTREDRSHGMTRIEVLCANCGGHLGHIFPDGPQPTGERYCINSAALEFDGAGPEG